MATKLSKPVSRETAKQIQGRNIIVSIAPCGSQSEARIGMRLKGKRAQYVGAVSSLYQVLALWHGQKLARAKKEARKSGISWHTAKKQFIADNSI